MNLRERIMEACNTAISKGLKVKPGAWGVDRRLDGSWAAVGREVDPAGALVLASQPIAGDNIEEAIAEVTETNTRWAREFAAGVDGDVGEGEAWALGRSVAEDLGWVPVALVPEGGDVEPPAEWQMLEAAALAAAKGR